MPSFPQASVSRLLAAVVCALLATSSLRGQSSVRAVKVLGTKDSVEIEVEASDRIIPQTQVLTGPDRLVIDFPNATPGKQLRSQSVDRGEVKDVRIGLFQSKPPVTRLVLDLKTAQSYQVFPSGRTVIIKVMGAGVMAGAEPSGGAGDFASQPARRPGLVVANYTTRSEPISIETSPQPLLDVTYRNGLLGIRANKVTLAQVLFAVQQRTGAEVSIAAGAEQEQVVADIVPAPAPEVLARLLNGSKFNFLILSAVGDPQQLDRVILSTRPEGGYVPAPPPPQPVVRAQNDEPEETEPASMNLQHESHPPAPAQVPQPGDAKTPPDDNTPDQ
jgi:antitoxin (DNA-binding transcriptional repressor) of toxin-antitoxin stability system